MLVHLLKGPKSIPDRDFSVRIFVALGFEAIISNHINQWFSKWPASPLSGHCSHYGSNIGSEAFRVISQSRVMWLFIEQVNNLLLN